MVVFTIDCTLPPHGTTFVQPPNARGTLDIVYSCLAVIVLCTWSVLHLNIPLQTTPRNRRQKLVRTLDRTFTKVGWMAFNVLAPEWPFAQAVCSLISQRRLQQKFDHYAERDQVPWTGSHTQLAHMGGFVLRFSQTPQNSMYSDHVTEQGSGTQCIVDKYCRNRSKIVSPQSHQTSMELHHLDANLQRYDEAGPSDDPYPSSIIQDLLRQCRNGKGCPHVIRTSRSSGTTTWKLDPVNIERARAAFAKLDKQQSRMEFLTEEVLRSPENWLANLVALCGDRWFLDANQLALARKLDIIEKLPQITEDEIGDLNKGDIFVKFLAVSQISWLCFQLVTRVARKLPITQLEIVTLAFAVTSIITYALLYSRPKDVQTVRELDATKYPTPAEISQIAAVGPEYIFDLQRDISIPNSAGPTTKENDFTASVTAPLLLFGGLHLLAWNYEFPTPVEGILWQASAILTIAAFPFTDMLARIPSDHRFAPPYSALMIETIAGSMLVVLVAARLFILVEVVRSLAYQPSESFYTTWAANVPHMGG